MPYQLSTSLHMFSKWLKSAAIIFEVVVTLGFPYFFGQNTSEPFLPTELKALDGST